LKSVEWQRLLPVADSGGAYAVFARLHSAGDFAIRQTHGCMAFRAVAVCSNAAQETATADAAMIDRLTSLGETGFGGGLLLSETMIEIRGLQ
jgi:hypothetical protein